MGRLVDFPSDGVTICRFGNCCKRKRTGLWCRGWHREQPFLSNHLMGTPGWKADFLKHRKLPFLSNCPESLPVGKVVKEGWHPDINWIAARPSCPCTAQRCIAWQLGKGLEGWWGFGLLQAKEQRDFVQLARVTLLVVMWYLDAKGGIKEVFLVSIDIGNQGSQACGAIRWESIFCGLARTRPLITSSLTCFKSARSGDSYSLVTSSFSLLVLLI
jgi:hypothetical protein